MPIENPKSAIENAQRAGTLLPAAAENILAFLDAGLPAWAEQSIAELVSGGKWSELNDRFYRYLEFGTRDARPNDRGCGCSS